MSWSPSVHPSKYCTPPLHSQLMTSRVLVSNFYLIWILINFHPVFWSIVPSYDGAKKPRGTGRAAYSLWFKKLYFMWVSVPFGFSNSLSLVSSVTVDISKTRIFFGITVLMKYQVYHPGPVTSTSKYYSWYCELICYLFVIMNNV